MGQEDVIKRLKEHLKARINQSGRLFKYDKTYSIRYVMDFMPYLSKAQAIQILKENIPDVINL